MTTGTQPDPNVDPRTQEAAENGIPDSPSPLRDLILRLERVASHLEAITGHARRTSETDRLEGKRQGVLLALSYARECQR